MLNALRKLFQQTVDPQVERAEQPSTPEEIEFSVPPIKGDAAGSITESQLDYLRLLKIPAPDSLGVEQASLLISCVQYVRMLFEEFAERDLKQCPPALYLRMLPWMLSTPEIVDYIRKWNKRQRNMDSPFQEPFKGKKNDPMHLEILRHFVEAGRA